MSRRNRPNRKTLVPAPQAAPPPVLHGNVFATFVREASALGEEVDARRTFDEDVGTYLKEKSLVEDFEAWRKAKRSPPNAK